MWGNPNESETRIPGEEKIRRIYCAARYGMLASTSLRRVRV